MFARLLAIVATSLLSLTVGSGAHAAKDRAAEPGTLDGGSPAQTGWWTTTNEPPPENGVAPPPAAPEPTAPAGSLPVAALLGEPQKASAIEFALEGETGSTVDTVLLSLRESTQNGLTVGAEEAVILACPITDAFWVGEEAGAWKRRPAFDCAAGAVTGARDEEGVWSFDLTALAAEWLSTTRTASPAVMLVSGPTAAEAQPATFQVTFDGVAAEGIGLVADTTAPRGGVPGLPATGPVAPSAPGGSTSGAGSTGGTGSAELGGDLGSELGASAPVAESGAAPLDAPAADAGAPTSTDAAPVAAGPATAPVSASPLATPSSWYSGLGASSVLLLVLGLGLAYAVMLALGPNAQPVGASGRRGVSRALDRLAAARGTVATKWGRS